jgi:FtsP/CotA-like multicopper oxidase with cupredoxin domain
MPDTGVTRSYDFHVSYQTIAPDGVQKNGLVVNNQFPGPLVEANWGDWIEVAVTNDLDNEGTSIHFHGFTQKETPWYDGVPSVAQCPVAPTKTFIMTFRADRYGSSWYHSKLPSAF